jgi:hypothetical protein
MPTGSTPFAVAVPATAKLFAGRVPPPVGAIAITGAEFNGGLRRLRSALRGFGEIIVAGLAFPLVVLAVGIPIALLVRLGIWIGQLL